MCASGLINEQILSEQAENTVERHNINTRSIQSNPITLQQILPCLRADDTVSAWRKQVIITSPSSTTSNVLWMLLQKWSSALRFVKCQLNVSLTSTASSSHHSVFRYSDNMRIISDNICVNGCIGAVKGLKAAQLSKDKDDQREWFLKCCLVIWTCWIVLSSTLLLSVTKHSTCSQSGGCKGTFFLTLIWRGVPL